LLWHANLILTHAGSAAAVVFTRAKDDPGRELSHGLIFGAAYTWSKLLGVGSIDPLVAK
jgi:hypothetical protein